MVGTYIVIDMDGKRLSVHSMTMVMHQQQ
jgi:hypothetical protein